MECNWNDRTKMLIGVENVEKMKKLKIVVIGLGGVGGSCCEALCRAGIGNIMIVDGDTIDITNVNRQIIATRLNIGKNKVDEMKKRLEVINPEVKVISKKEFCLPENGDFIFEYSPDYIIDAIDTITTKIFLIETAKKNNINIISCMGMGNRYDPLQIRCGILEDTLGTGCVVSRIMRSKMRKLGISDVNVVYSLEKAKKVVTNREIHGKHVPGSFACVPPVAGYFLAYKVIKDLIL